MCIPNRYDIINDYCDQQNIGAAKLSILLVCSRLLIMYDRMSQFSAFQEFEKLRNSEYFIIFYLSQGCFRRNMTVKCSEKYRYFTIV